MYGWTIYSLKVGACLALFYLFFKLLLSRETLHRFNRMVVLGTMLLSFALPLCVITVTREYPVPPELFGLPDIPTAFAETGPAPEAEPFSWELLVGCLYLTGVLAMLVATGLSVWRVMRLVRSGRREKLENGFVLVRLPQETTSFSWWRYIVISEADYAGCGREIITHETAHLRLHHSWDLLATDVAGCLQWFNPAMWLLRSELRAIHEYEADEAVLNSGADARQYQLLLIKKAAGGRWYSVANNFNHSKLKNRITMMLQKRSSRWAGAKALFVVPLAGLALGAFAETVYVPVFEDKSKQNSAMEELFAEKSDKQVTIRVQVVDPSGEPMEGVIMQEHGTQHGTTTDPSGRASLQIAESSSVDLRMAGYETVNLSYRDDRTTLTGRGLMRTIERSGAEVSMQVQMRPGTETSETRESHIEVQVDKTSGDPIVIRGAGFDSDAENQPLLLVDGKEVADLKSIDPERIKQIDVLKGASTVPYIEKYGDKAKNGVVLVTLKKSGEPDNVRWDKTSDDTETSETRESHIEVQVDKTSGDPIVIRGAGFDSDAENQPLLLVDGKEVADLKSIDPERIKQIDVLKGASTVPYIEKYGDKAKNGVVLVTLKKPGEPDNVPSADGDDAKLEDVVVVGYGIDLQSPDWKKKLAEAKRNSAGFSREEFEQKMQELKKDTAALRAYFQSDEWKASEKAMKEANDYFQSDEWKEAQRTLGKGFRFETETANGTKIIFIDGEQATEADVKALDGKRIRSVNINKDKQSDGSVISTIAIATKGHGMYAVRAGADARTDAWPLLGVKGSPVEISTDGKARTYKGKFRFTDLSNLPQKATILLDGKAVSRQELVGKKLRLAQFYMGVAAAGRGNIAGLLQCSSK